MSRTHDAILAVIVGLVAIVFGWIENASALAGWTLAGAIVAIVAELRAYRRADRVRSLFDRPASSLLAAAVGGVTVGVGAIVAPDRSLSLAVGALGTYCCMLAIVAVRDWIRTSTAGRDETT